MGQAGRRAWPGLLELAPLAVVKDGAWGCRVLWRDAATGTVRQLDVAAQRVGRVDTTGAGDAFAAGFLFTLARAGGLSAGRRDPGGWRDPVPWPDLSCGARRWPATRLPRRPCGAVARRSTRGEPRRARTEARYAGWAMSPTTDRLTDR